ncbi:MAG: YCF48-related protein [Solirubrobacterales bacterium]
MLKRLLVSVSFALVLALTAAGAAGAAVVAGNTGWFWSNPLPQGNTLTKVEAISGRAYVAGEAGAILRSDDGGASWTGIRSGLPAAKSAVRVIRAVTPDTVIFAGSCALRRTDDGGATVKRLPWNSSDVSCPSAIKSLSFPTASVGYLLLENGDILQTQDGGDSWRRQPAAPGSQLVGGNATVNDIWFTSATSGVLSVAGQIWSSTDSGVSWTPVKDIDGGGGAQFKFISSTVGYAVGSGTSLYKTIDGGATWNAVAGDGKINSIVVGQLACSSVSTCLATSADGSQILRTTDGGSSWTSLKASSRAIYGVGFTSAAHAVAVGAGGASVSTDDGGVNWSLLNAEVLGSYNSIHVDSASTAVLYGGGTGLARTTDSGASWKPITTFASGSIRDATFPTATRGYVLDSRNQLTRSDDAGLTWKVLDMAGAKPSSLYASGAQSLLLIGGKGVRRSLDGGLTFKTPGGSGFRKLALTKADPAGKAIVAWGSKAIVSSSDGGKTWKKIALGKKVKSVKLADFVDAKNGWIVDGSNELWVTTKGGTKWTRVETTGLDKITSMARTDGKHGYIADGSGSVLVTADGGKTWAQESPFLSASRIATTVAPLSAKGAILLVPNTNTILTTSTFGQIGSASKLTISTAKKSVKKNSEIRVSGKLSPSQGGEQVTVLARALDAKGGTHWVSQTATVSLGGTFTTTWKIGKATIFTATWAGDATHDGDGASALIVKLGSGKKK